MPNDEQDIIYNYFNYFNYCCFNMGLHFFFLYGDNMQFYNSERYTDTKNIEEYFTAVANGNYKSAVTYTIGQAYAAANGYDYGIDEAGTQSYIDTGKTNAKIDMIKHEITLPKSGANTDLHTSYMEDAEPDIINAAGREGKVAVTTSTCGRGTDIIAENMLLICLGAFEDRCVENQVRGRVGRQGLAGESIVLSSLDEEIWDYLSVQERQNIYQNFEFMNLDRILKSIRSSRRDVLKKERKRLYDLSLLLEMQRLCLNNEIKNIKADIFNNTNIKKKFEVFGDDVFEEFLNRVTKYVYKTIWSSYRETVKDIIMTENIAKRGDIAEIILALDKEYQYVKNSIRDRIAKLCLSARPIICKEKDVNNPT